MSNIMTKTRPLDHDEQKLYATRSKKYHTMDVLAVPNYDNGYGITLRPHRKTVYIDAGPSLPVAPTRSTSVNKVPALDTESVRQDILRKKQVSEIQIRKPIIKQPVIRPKSQHVSFIYTKDNPVPLTNQIKRKPLPATYRNLDDATPGMHKQVNRKLLPVPTTSRNMSHLNPTQQIRRIQSRSELLSRCAARGQDLQMGNPQTTLSSAGVATSIVDRHLAEGKVTKFDPDIYTHGDRGEIRAAAAAVSRQTKNPSRCGKPAASSTFRNQVMNGRSKSKSKKSICSVM